MAARTASSSSATPATKGAASAAALWMPAAASSTAGGASSWRPSTPAEREATRERHAACVAEWRRHPRWSASTGRQLNEDIHGGFRFGFNFLVDDCDRQLDAAEGDASNVKVNVALFQELVQSLEGHHRMEDDVVFPRIVARHPDMKPAMDFLEKDHTYLHPLQERVLKKGDEAALREFTSFLEDHLMREEMAVVPLSLDGCLNGVV